MSDYTKTTDFTAKDNLTTGDSLKVIKGAYFDTEFDDIVTAIGTKYDSSDLASQAEAQAGTSNTKLMTPLRAENHITTWAGENDAMVADIHALNLAADAILGWDQSASAAIGFTLGAGLSFSTTTLNLNSAVAGAGMTMTSQVLNVIGGDGITANANDIAISSSAAGAGMTFSSGVLNVVGGSGITANANDIIVDSTVIRTTGAQSLAGIKTFTDGIQLNDGDTLTLGTGGDLVLSATGTTGTIDGVTRLNITGAIVSVGEAAGKVGWFGAAGLVKPTITGASVQAALDSFLVQFHNMGLFTKNTTY